MLNEKRAGVQPRALASGRPANSLRISSHTPRNVAGTERGVRPIGDWSTASARLMVFGTRIESCGPGVSATSFSCLRSAGKNTFCTRVLLPEPLTPATTHMRPTGTRNVTFCRLLARAPSSSSHASAIGRFGRTTPSGSRSARPVGEASHAKTAAGVPSAMM